MGDDLVGKKFSMLTVVSFCESRKGRKFWNCVCECGNTTVVNTRDLRSLRIKSCGCLADINRYKKHDMSGTRLYTILRDMKARCYNSKSKDYSRYGGRGITICDEWMDFCNFKDWALSHGYNDNLPIDRIDFNKGYCPENCRWVDLDIQSNNKSTSIFVTFNGEKKTISQWAKQTGIDKNTIRGRLLRGWPPELALTFPTDSKGRLVDRFKEVN